MYKGYRHLFISIVWICMNSNSEYILIAILIFWHHYNVFPPNLFFGTKCHYNSFFLCLDTWSLSSRNILNYFDLHLFHRKKRLHFLQLNSAAKLYSRYSSVFSSIAKELNYLMSTFFLVDRFIIIVLRYNILVYVFLMEQQERLDSYITYFVFEIIGTCLG